MYVFCGDAYCIVSLSVFSVGIGIYATAILLTLLSAFSMSAISQPERWLPSRTAAVIVLLFKLDFIPQQDRLSELMKEMGYDVAWNSLVINY